MIRLDPKFATAYNGRGWTKTCARQYSVAIADYDEAMRLDPKMTHPINNKSFVLSTCADESIRDARQAMKLAERCLELDLKNAYGMNAKACAYAVDGDDAAIEWQKKALENIEFAKDDSFDGGEKALERIHKWESKELWFLP